MKTNDTNQSREQRFEQYRADMQKAFTNSDVPAFDKALEGMMQLKAEALKDEYEQKIQQMLDDCNTQVLTARGANQLTAEERSYYQQFADAAKSAAPKQAVENLSARMPKTIIDRVFEDLRTNHPLLSKINFMATAGMVEMFVNTNGYQEAAWGQLTDEIVKELTGGLRMVSATLFKLSAFLPIAKSMLDLGPEWLDRFIRETLYEAFANGMEAGIVAGTGKNQPIGMIRKVGTGANLTDGIALVDGVYPEKDAIPVSNLSAATVGGLLAKMAESPDGKARRVENVLMIVHPVDYYQKVMPATTLMAPDGTYRNDVMPYPMDIVNSPSVPKGKVVLGLGKRYLALLGTAKEGKIEYSDHYRFLEDERVYLIKGYANGMPMDDNAFLLLDISELQAIMYMLTQITPAADAGDAAE